ncbi:zinc-binding dehydrogenase [Streptomyces sp. NPDC048258]|uniref:zinc-binding dehydrogenase n=1 Tax=Streptomyces sp. NPDC048258 TaxID=3365527 RepID=UPI0037235012
MLHNKQEAVAEGLRHLLELIGSGQVKPVVHERLPLAEAAKAHELLEARAQLGKVVLVP